MSPTTLHPETLRFLADELEQEANYHLANLANGPITKAVVRKLRAKAALYRKRAGMNKEQAA